MMISIFDHKHLCAWASCCWICLERSRQTLGPPQSWPSCLLAVGWTDTIHHANCHRHDASPNEALLWKQTWNSVIKRNGTWKWTCEAQNILGSDCSFPHSPLIGSNDPSSKRTKFSAWNVASIRVKCVLQIPTWWIYTVQHILWALLVGGSIIPWWWFPSRIPFLLQAANSRC